MEYLVERAKKGHKASFVKLIDQVKEKAFRTAYMHLGNNEDAKDALQETILKAYEKISALRENRFFETWFIRILLNECNDLLRERSKIISIREKEAAKSVLYEEENTGSVEMKIMIRNLPKIYREVIDLRYNHDMKVEQIGDVLGIPSGTVKSRLHMALLLLRKKLVREEAGNEV